MITDYERITRAADQDYAVSRADAAERVKIQMSIADATMKALLLANGGAMIALFTFVGNLVAKSSKTVPFDPSRLWTGFFCFVAGLVAALLVHAFAFLSQDRFYNQSMIEAWRHQRTSLDGIPADPGERELQIFGQGHAFYSIAFFLAIVSMTLFAVGCGFALGGVLV